MKHYLLASILFFGILGLAIFFFSRPANTFTIESSAFKTMSLIPPQYTCKGANISPPLNWHNAPLKTQSFALIVDEPYVAHGAGWTNWILFNIPPTITSLAAGAPAPDGAISSKNSEGSFNYSGPCPALAMQSYTFKLYALDTVLSLKEDADRFSLSRAMTGHVLATAELVGIYQREWYNETTTP